MAVIKFTQADKMQAVTMTPGWYPLTITEIDGPKDSKSGSSTNIFITFEIADGKYKGKQFTHCFNSAMSNPSVLGDMYYVPHSHLVKVAAGIKGVKVDEIDELDTDEIRGNAFDGFVDLVTKEGNMIHILTQAVPFGASANAAKLPF